jgi:hypothetical protein
VDEIYHQHPVLRRLPQQGPASEGFKRLPDVNADISLSDVRREKRHFEWFQV